MAYQAQVRRTQPALLIFLLDQSLSMKDPCPGSRRPKAEFLADAVNAALRELVGRCSKMNDTTGDQEVRSYFDICILGYGGNPPKVTSAFGGPLESAATLGVIRHFRAYKPARENAGFLEIEHLDPRYLGRRFPVCAGDPPSLRWD